MIKEIHEQPRVLRRLATERAGDAEQLAAADRDARHGAPGRLRLGRARHQVRRVSLLAHRRAPGNSVVGSEFGYLADFLDATQPGVGSEPERRDDRPARLDEGGAAAGRALAALVNVEGSSLYRLVDHRPALRRPGALRAGHQELHRQAGGAADGRLRRARQLEEGAALVERAADEIQAFLTDGRRREHPALAAAIADREHLYVIGRGPSYPMALEAALKIKEVSYMHAEGFAGGELKHGVIALIEPGTPCLVLAPHDETFRAIVSGAQEIKARGGYIVGISPTARRLGLHIPVADVGEAASIVNAVPPRSWPTSSPCCAASTPTSRGTWPRA